MLNIEHRSAHYKIVNIARACLLAVVLLIPLSGQAADATTSTHILMLNSWHPDMPWQASFDRGVKAELQGEGQAFHVYSEYMDAGRFPESEIQQTLRTYLEDKYATRPIDMIITESRPAANFLISNPNFLPHAKRIFVQPGSKLEGQITVPVDIDFTSAITEMDRLVSPRKVYVVADTSTVSRKKRLDDFNAALGILSVGFETEYLTDLPIGDLLEKLSQLPEESAIFYLLIFKDGEGRKLSPYHAAQLMAERANAPVFSHWEALMGSGILGGYLLSGERVGHITAASVKKIVLGQVPLTKGEGVFGHYYDWRQLKRWDIASHRLPPGADIQFYEATLIEQYKWQVIAILSALILLAALSGGLVAANQKRKRAVSQLEQQQNLLARRVAERTAKLQESEEKYRSIFEASKVGFALCKMDGSLAECNQAYLNIIGYTEEEAVKLTYWDLTPRSFEKDEAKQLKSLEETGAYGPYEKYYIRKNGSKVPVLLNGTKLEGEDGQDYIWSIVQDITERTLLEKSKAEFISTVSHELRTPLTSIKGSLGLLAGGAAGDLPDKAKDMLAIANNNVEQLISLVSDILDLEKLQSGKMEFQFEVFDLVDLVSVGLKANHGYAQEHGVEFRFSEPSQAINVMGDTVRIMQVITNLLSNAVKFSPKGEHVLISLEADETHAKVSVTDRGPGIADKFQERIFERFAQEDASDQRAKGGTGLGLSICKTIIDKHEGEIGFDTEVGKGTTFHFILPLSA